MANLRVLPQTVSQVHSQRVKLAVAAAVCGLGYALPLLTPELQGFPLASVSPSLTQLAQVPTLRLPVSLANGTQIQPPQGEKGYSQLTIENGNSVDAVAKLTDQATGETLRFVYIRAGQMVKLDDLGTYSTKLKFALGTDWDEKKNRFRRNQSLKAFSDPLNFTVEYRNNGEFWRTYKITLHPVFNGDAKTEPISESDF